MKVSNVDVARSGLALIWFRSKLPITTSIVVRVSLVSYAHFVSEFAAQDETLVEP